MHELAIAESIVSSVLDLMREKDFHAVEVIALRIGSLTDVVPDALLFGFEVITKETPLAETTLSIETIPAQGRCRACQKEFAVEQLLFLCPDCRSGDIDLIHGQELDIAYLEVDDGRPSA
jgi:hydrogenase nickel incorporation protein HypA/HybF